MANVSSSNGLEKRPKLRFPGFDEPWKATAFGDIVHEFSNRTKVEDEDVLLSAAIEGMFLNTELFGHQRGASNKGYKKIKYGTMVLSTQNLHLGNANVNQRFEHGMVSPAYKTYDISGCSIDLIAQWIKSDAAKRFFYNATTVGASVCRRNVEWDTLYGQSLFLPSLPEQEKIANLLTLLSNRIEKQRQLIIALKKYKRGLLSQLIAQKKAFNTSREWKTVKLGHIFKERTERAKGNETLLAVTISNGVQRRDEIDLKDNSSDDKSNYKCVYIGDIAYNTMRMWQGASGVSPYNGIVSPAYTIVTPIRPDAHNMTFWAYYFKYSPLVQTFQKYSQGLTSDTWNLKFPQFSEITVTMPSKYEQDKIAECLSVFDEHCKCEEGKLQVLFQVRTSLLQQLFI